MAPGDFLVFQLESGFGLIRVLAIDGDDPHQTFHIAVYEEFFPDVEAAENRITDAQSLKFRDAHLALTSRAFERTPAAMLGNAALTEAELTGFRKWQGSATPQIFDRSLLLLLGMR
jgi:hypothetical protein